MKSSNKIFFESLRKAPYRWWKFISRYYLVLGSIYASLVAISIVTHYFSNHPDYKSALTLILSLCVYIYSLVFIGVSTLFIIPYFFQKLLNKDPSSYVYIPDRFSDFARMNFRPWVKEMSKVMSLSYLWGLLFIIPGIVKFVRCTFVSYIALFSRSFQRREISALKHSAQLTRGFLLLFVLMISTYVAGTYHLNVFIQGLKTEGLTAVAVGAICADYLLSLSSCLFFTIVYHTIYLKIDYHNTVETESYEDIEPPVSLSL